MRSLNGSQRYGAPIPDTVGVKAVEGNERRDGGFDSNRSAFYLSRQRHGAGMNQGRLHRHVTAAVCGSCASTKNPCRTKPPAPDFSLPHTTLSQSQSWSLRVLFYCPRPPSVSGYRGGRAALLLSHATCHDSHPPQVAPCAICEAAMVEC